MTVPSTTTRVQYTCDGVTTVFPVAIQAYYATDFDVVLTTVAGAELMLTLNSDYTMATSGSLVPPDWTLTCTDAAPWPAGATLQIILNPTQTQNTIYNQGQAFPSAALQANIDRLTQMVLRLQDQLNRCLRFPDGDPVLTSLLPGYASRAGDYLAFDTQGNAVLLAPASSSSGGPGLVSASTVVTQLLSQSAIANVAQLSVNIAAAGSYIFEILVGFQPGAMGGFECSVNYSGAFTGGGGVALGCYGQASSTGQVSNSIFPVVGNPATATVIVAAGNTSTATQFVLVKGSVIASGAGTLAFAFGPATPGVACSILPGSYASIQQAG